MKILLIICFRNICLTEWFIWRRVSCWPFYWRSFGFCKNQCDWDNDFIKCGQEAMVWEFWRKTFLSCKYRWSLWFARNWRSVYRNHFLWSKFTLFRIQSKFDHFVRAYGETYGLPYIITNCSNNYGPFHFQKNWFRYLSIILSIISHYLFYGDGNYTRDWLFVKDHAVAVIWSFMR